MNTSELDARLAEARANAETLERARLDLEAAMLTIGRITGRNGLDACVAGILLRVQRALLGPAK